MIESSWNQVMCEIQFSTSQHLNKLTDCYLSSEICFFSIQTQICLKITFNETFWISQSVKQYSIKENICLK